jgi:uncharacterized membrane protein
MNTFLIILGIASIITFIRVLHYDRKRKDITVKDLILHCLMCVLFGGIGFIILLIQDISDLWEYLSEKVILKRKKN